MIPTDLEALKAENRDLKFDKLNLNRRIDQAHSENHFLEAKCLSLEKQLRISEYWLRIERNK
jgi:hypothetical protein